MASSTASAGVWIGGGVEYFTWGEYLDYSVGGVNQNMDLVQSSGFRPFVEAKVDFPFTERTRLALAGRAYAGNVDFSYQDTPEVDATMDYRGGRAEGGLVFTPLPHGEHKEVGFVLMGGYEMWTRKLVHDVYEYEEEWKMPFLRLGAQLETPDTGGWGARGGIIYPFDTKDHVKTESVTYYPEEAPSFYFGLGRRFSRFFEVGLNYEGYRFTTLDPASDFASPRVETDTYQFYLNMGI